MTLLELASYLNVSERTIYEWLQRDIVPAFKIGAAWRFRREDIDAWLETQRSGPDVGTPLDRCCLCSRPFNGSLLEGGHCEYPGCRNPICETCWGTLNRRHCVAHRPADPGDVPTSGPGHPRTAGMDVTSARFMDGFARRVESRPHLLGSDGVPVAEVKNWKRVKSTGEGRSPAVRGSRPSRGKTAQAPRISMWTAYKLRVPPGRLTAVERDIRFEARCLAVGAPGNRRRRTAPGPVSASELEALLTEARAHAEAEGLLYVLGIFAPQGWSDGARELLVSDHPAERFLNPNLSAALAGSQLSDIYWNSNDEVLGQIGHYFWATFDDELARCKARIRDVMTESAVYLAKSLVEEDGFSMVVARSAIDAMVAIDELESRTEYGLEVIVKKEA